MHIEYSTVPVSWLPKKDIALISHQSDKMWYFSGDCCWGMRAECVQPLHLIRKRKKTNNGQNGGNNATNLS